MAAAAPPPPPHPAEGDSPDSAASVHDLCWLCNKPKAEWDGRPASTTTTSSSTDATDTGSVPAAGAAIASDAGSAAARPATGKCSRCKLVSYCGRACQRRDWPWHKKTCISPAKQAEREAARQMQQAAAARSGPETIMMGGMPVQVINGPPAPTADHEDLRRKMRQQQLSGRLAAGEPHLYHFANTYGEEYFVVVHDPVAGAFSLYGDETAYREIRFPGASFMLGNTESAHIKRILIADVKLRNSTPSAS